MKKSTISAVVATAIACFANVSNAATLDSMAADWRGMTAEQRLSAFNAAVTSGDETAIHNIQTLIKEMPVASASAPVASPVATPAAPIAAPTATPHAAPAAAPSKLIPQAPVISHAAPVAPTLAPQATPTKSPSLILSNVAPKTPVASYQVAPTKTPNAPVVSHAAPVTPVASVQATPSKIPTFIKPEYVAPVTPVASAYVAPSKTPSAPVINAPAPLTKAAYVAPTAKTPNAPVINTPAPLTKAANVAPAPLTKADYVAPTSKTPNAPTLPTVIAPQAAPTATPVSTGYREPQNVVVPTVIAPQAAPARVPSQTVPATPEARRPVTIAPYQAPVGKEIAGTGYKGEAQEVVITSNTVHAEAAPVEVVKEERAPAIAAAGNGAFGQPGTAPANQATDYDEAQDKVIQSITAMANSGINKTQTNAQGINTVATQVGQNTQAIATTNAQVAQNTQGIQTVQTTLQTGTYETTADYQAGQAAQDAEIAKTNKKVADHDAELSNHENRIQDLEANRGYGNKFKALKNQVDANRKRASAGIAGVAAMANIPQVLNSQTFAIGAGVGTTDGETGLAVGFSARASEHTTVKMAVSNDTQHNFVVGAGVAYGW